MKKMIFAAAAVLSLGCAGASADDGQGAPTLSYLSQQGQYAQPSSSGLLAFPIVGVRQGARDGDGATSSQASRLDPQRAAAPLQWSVLGDAGKYGPPPKNPDDLH